MTMEPRKSKKIKVLMLPWLGHGHVTPFMELAKKLSRRDLQIYFCSTPVILGSLKKRKKFTNDDDSIEFVEFHLPSSPELPPDRHTTNGLPSHLMPSLKKAFDMAGPSFSAILETLKPDLIIQDYNQLPATAVKYDIPTVRFISTGATVGAFFVHRIQKPDVEFPFPEIRLGEFHEKQFQDMIRPFTNGRARSDSSPVALKTTTLFNTFRELEGKGFDYLKELSDKNVNYFAVGPLVRDAGDEEDDDRTSTQTLQWLDKKENSSTVFVSFGSEYFLSNDDMEEIAHGLELSTANFIWVVRFPAGQRVSVSEALPEGFCERVGERGLVMEDWAPQARILAHSSTGGFVSHCGWNSILESLKFGAPMVAIPMHLDQPINARLVEGAGVAVEVKRGGDGRLSREEIAEAIRKVVKGNDGEEIRVKAREFRDKIRVTGEEEVDMAVEEFVRLCANNKS